MRKSRNRVGERRALSVRRICTLAAVLVATLAVTGCPWRTKPVPRPPCDRSSTNAEVLAALYSIFYRAAEAGSLTPVPGWKPFPLEKAAEFLRCDPDIEVVRTGRIRRAAIKLASGIVLLKCRRRGRAEIDEFRRALEVLEVPPILVDKLREGITCTGLLLPQLEDKGGGIIDTEKDLEDLQRACCPCIDSCRIGPWGQVSVAEFKIVVDRESSCVFQVIDPQCWDQVVPLNFEDTFIVDNAPCNSSNEPVCRSTLICDPALSAPLPKPMPTAPTTPWCGLLSERLKASSQGISSKLTTALKVRTRKPNSTSYAMDYGLCESREYEICNPSCAQGKCAVEMDCGDASIESQSATSAAIFGTKFIRFKAGLTPDLNAWAPIALEVMVSEVAQAACRPASTCAGVPTGTCTTTTVASMATGAAQKPQTCACTGPQDSCKQEQKMTPKGSPPFCP